MRSFGSWLFFVHVVFCQGLLSQAVSPPVSLDGKGYQFSIAGDYSWTVPLERVFDSGSYDEGFSGSLLDADQPYMYANGVVTTDGGDELRLTFTSATSGTYQYWELNDGEPELDEVGTFSEVTPSLELKDDWQHMATMDSALSTNYWNSGLRGIDSLEYNDGELSFLIGDVGYAVENQGELEIAYGRTLPMDENWQVVLDDIYVSDSVELFEIKLDLEVAGTDFECGFSFGTENNADYGNKTGAAHVGVDIEYEGLDKYAFVDNSNDVRIANSLNLRVVHIAISRELVFEYQPDGASSWTELARLNLANGGFTGSNATEGGFSGELVSTLQRMVFGVQVEAGQAIQANEMEVSGIEIGSFTPPLDPPASVAGLQFEYLPNGVSLSALIQELYGEDGYVLNGFSGSVLERVPYTYTNGVITLTEFNEEIRLTFESTNSGTYQLVELYGGSSYIDETGTFSIVTPSLEQKTDWQRTETFASELSTDYWNIEHDTEHAVEVANGALNFIFADADEEYADEEHEIDIDYGRTLPLNENWQIVLDDVYATSFLDEFDVEFELDVEAAGFECELDFDWYDNTRHIGFSVTLQSASGYLSAYASVSANEDPRLQESVSIRVQHDAAVRELVFEYKPDGATGWTKLARLNLVNGDFSGLNSEGNQFSGELVSITQRMVLDFEVEAGEATQVGDLKIGGIQIGSYTPPVWELYDDFSGGALDAQKWETWYLPGGTEPSVVDGQLFIENGSGGTVRKPVAFESTLAAAGIGFEPDDAFNTGYATGITFTDSSIIGVEADLSLPVNSVDWSNVMIELFEQVSATEIRMAAVSLEVYASQPSLFFYQQPIVNGAHGQYNGIEESHVNLGDFYRLRLVRQGGAIQMYRGDTLMATYVAQGELIGFSILAGNYGASSMYATVDNVRVLRDYDGDGLSNSVETNTGVYVSASDTGTNPLLADSSGDGFTDGEVVSAGLSPVVDYSSLLAIVRNNPERFELEDTNSTVDMKLRGLRLERAGNGAFNMNFDLEMSTDLQTWAPHTSHSVELSVPDQSKAFMRLKVK
jgi:hypothetical protein